MAALILPSRRVWQPQGPTGIDSGNPLARGLALAVYGGGNGLLSAFGPGLKVPGTTELTQGLGKFGKSCGGAVEFSSVGNLGTSAFSAFIFGDLPSTGSFGSSEQVSNGFGFGYNGQASCYMRIGSSWADQGSGIYQGTKNTGYGFTFDGSTFRVYGEGRLNATQAISGSVTHSPLPFRFNQFPGGGQTGDGKVSLFFAFNRTLSDAEVLELWRRPHQLFRPIQRRIMVAVPSGGTVTLSIADSTHGHTADGLTVSTASALTVAEASHAHTAEALTLSTGTSLAVAEALHSHVADAPALTTNSALAVADASHGHTADNLTLSAATGDTLAVQDATHAHSAEGLTLTTAQHLAVADSAHSHTAEAPALSTQILLTVSDASHAHSVDNLTLSDVPALVIASVMHAHAADSVALTSQAWLATQDALHAHQADNLSLSAFDADDELYPLAGLTQEWPRTGSQTFPLAGLRQKFPLE